MQVVLVSIEKSLGAMGTTSSRTLNLTFVYAHFENSAGVPVAFSNKFLEKGKDVPAERSPEELGAGISSAQSHSLLSWQAGGCNLLLPG